MKKYRFSLQFRLTILSAIVLALCCFFIYLFISRSALMRMDQMETDFMTIQIGNDAENSEVYDVQLSTIAPDLTDMITKTKHNFKIQCLVITIFVVAIGSFLTWLISGMALKPLKKLTHEIGDVSENSLSKDLPIPSSKDEVRELTISFNRMLHRLDAAFQTQKQFSANAAHELRTPLAVMQTNLEVLKKKADCTPEEYDEAISRTLIQTDRLSSLVNSLLELLSLHNVPLEDDIELLGLAEEIICDLGPLADQSGVTLSLTGTEFTLHGNDGLIYRALYNLIENAIKYNHAGGFVKVDVTANTVTVSDSGCGIAREEWDQIFTPFYRVDKARSRSMGGAGLGLALVSDIAAVHKGTVSVVDSSKQGSVIQLKFS